MIARNRAKPTLSVVALDRNGGVRVVLTNRALPSGQLAAEDFAVSDDYKKLLLAEATPGGTWRLIKMTISTRDTTTLSAGSAARAVWGPDSQSVAFTVIPTSAKQPYRIHVMRNGTETVLPAGQTDPSLGLSWG